MDSGGGQGVPRGLPPPPEALDSQDRVEHTNAAVLFRHRFRDRLLVARTRPAYRQLAERPRSGTGQAGQRRPAPLAQSCFGRSASGEFIPLWDAAVTRSESIRFFVETTETLVFDGGGIITRCETISVPIAPGPRPVEPEAAPTAIPAAPHRSLIPSLN